MKIRACFHLILFLFCLSVIPQPAVAQLSTQQILKIIAANDLQTTRARLGQLSAKYPASPELLYLKAMLVENGATAFKSYSYVYSKFKASRHAPDALMKIAQYNYAKGDYERARVFFTAIVTKYPNAENRRLAQYFAAKTLLAQSKLEAAESELKRVRKKAQDATIISLVKEDLAYIEKLKQASSRPEAQKMKNKSRQKGKYAVQIGAYSRKTNALNQVQYFGNLGYSTEIITYKSSNGMLYRVIIGRYQDEVSARRNGEKFKSIFKKPFRVIELKNR